MTKTSRDHFPRSTFPRLLGYPGFAAFWLADSLSNVGIFVFTLSLQLLLIDVMSAGPLEIGWVRSAQWLPSLLFGLAAGVVIDRLPRKRLLITADLISCALLLLIAALAMTGHLNPILLAALVFGLGTAAVFQGGAHQSFLADMLPTELLTAGNVKLSQTYTAAQTLGPLLGGLLVRTVGAPLALLANALSYGASALLLMRVPQPTRHVPPQTRSLAVELREGISWVYGHRLLAPYAWCLHLWFIGNAIAGTIFVFHATSLGLNPAQIGLTLACAGLAGIAGAALAEPISRRIGWGIAILSADFITGAAWILAAFSQMDFALPILCAAQFIYGFGLGMRGPLEMTLRNTLTPSALRGRMNTTIRSINWGLIAVAAPLGGWVATRIGTGPTLSLAGAIMIGTGLALLASPFRGASISDANSAG
ncbi:Predicted arabinose efflux permease, MFS family [Devosia lucknowensis]|uniref:Predicted arabinose efflux permease, MFS family n=1 Tax=Devosia lucknowensis TaxID=1096929 RepID=A0A1Y6E5G8_9HYPH|nr:MFS transporter [Devosia lucknowensis]SMQ57996.1 Predicted arabinose efflux permease, MFS family [Devosia lucknowensis]